MLGKLTDPDERDRVRLTVERAAQQGEHSLRIGAISGLARAGDGRRRERPILGRELGLGIEQRLEILERPTIAEGPERAHADGLVGAA